MPRTLSDRALASVMAQHTDEAFILLMTFTYAPTNEIYRCALNTENIVSNGNVFTATYFDIQLPESSNQAPQGCQITLDNVDMRLIGLLRGIAEPLKIVIQVVLASQPDVIEMEFTDLVLREVQWDASKINGRLVSEDPLNQAFPGHMYEPRTFPGIF